MSENLKFVLAGVGAVFIISLLGAIGYFFTHLDDGPEQIVETVGMHTLTLNYTGDDTWQYLYEGYTPTPCDTYNLEMVILESDPEQVNFEIETISSDAICAQMIQEVEETGTFQASPDATFSFVEKE